jgi:hypothetical protein
MSARKAPSCNSEERIAELRRHALNHAAARGPASRGQGYPVVVRAWEADGSTSEHAGFINAVAAPYVRLVLLKRTGGGVLSISFRRVVSIERAPYIPSDGEVEP